MRPNLVRVKGFLSLKTERWSSELVAANNAAFGRFVSFSLKCAITCRKKSISADAQHRKLSKQNLTAEGNVRGKNLNSALLKQYQHATLLRLRRRTNQSVTEYLNVTASG